MTLIKRLATLLLLAGAAFAQTQNGKGFGWTNATSCMDPNGTVEAFCVTDNGALLVSFAGKPYQNPTNFAGGSPLTVGITTTLPPGSAATVSITNNQLNIGVPQGIQGIKGDTGAQGPQGVQGPQGLPGKDFTSAKGFSCKMTFDGNLWTATNCTFN